MSHTRTSSAMSVPRFVTRMRNLTTWPARTRRCSTARPFGVITFLQMFDVGVGARVDHDRCRASPRGRAARRARTPRASAVGRDDRARAHAWAAASAAASRSAWASAIGGGRRRRRRRGRDRRDRGRRRRRACGRRASGVGRRCRRRRRARRRLGQARVRRVDADLARPVHGLGDDRAEDVLVGEVHPRPRAPARCPARPSRAGRASPRTRPGSSTASRAAGPRDRRSAPGCRPARSPVASSQMNIPPCSVFTNEPPRTLISVVAPSGTRRYSAPARSSSARGRGSTRCARGRCRSGAARTRRTRRCPRRSSSAHDVERITSPSNSASTSNGGAASRRPSRSAP